MLLKNGKGNKFKINCLSFRANLSVGIDKTSRNFILLHKFVTFKTRIILCYTLRKEGRAFRNIGKYIPILCNQPCLFSCTNEIPGFCLLLKNHIFIARNEATIFIFHVWGYWKDHHCHGYIITLTELRCVAVWSKHHRILLGYLRKSSVIFGNVWKRLSGLPPTFGKSSESVRKSSESRKKVVICMFIYYMPACGYEFYLLVFNSISHYVKWSPKNNADLFHVNL